MASKTGKKASKPQAADRTVDMFSGKTELEKLEDLKAAAASEEVTTKKSGQMEPEKLPLTWVHPKFTPSDGRTVHLARLESGSWVLQIRSISNGKTFSVSDCTLPPSGFKALVQCVREAIQLERRALGEP